MRHAALALCVLLCSCASIVDGGPDVLTVSSEPEGATVVLHGSTPVGKTPMQVSIPRNDNDFVGLTLQLDGFHSQAVEVSKTVNGWFFGNILFGGLVGMIVDLANANITKVATDAPLHVVLVPTSQPAPASFTFPRPASRPAATTGWKPASE